MLGHKALGWQDRRSPSHVAQRSCPAQEPPADGASCHSQETGGKPHYLYLWRKHSFTPWRVFHGQRLMKPMMNKSPCPFPGASGGASVPSPWGSWAEAGEGVWAQEGPQAVVRTAPAFPGQRASAGRADPLPNLAQNDAGSREGSW